MHIHNKPGWLSLIAERASLSEEDVLYLDRLDEAWALKQRTLNAQWREDVRHRMLSHYVETSGSKCHKMADSHSLAIRIQIARARSLESVLAEPPIKGFIHCPVHKERVGHPDERPSMWVKGGFGYCFSCNASLDAIGYLMKVRGLTFQQAVSALQ